MWSSLSSFEVKPTIGCLLFMGIIKLPNYKLYWSVDNELFSVPGIRNIIKFQRFQDIYNNLCFQDPEFLGENMKISKISTLSTIIISNSQFYYRPQQNLSMDEAMIAFSGRSALKVYMPKKIVKVGLKAKNDMRVSHWLCSKLGFILK